MTLFFIKFILIGLGASIAIWALWGFFRMILDLLCIIGLVVILGLSYLIERYGEYRRKRNERS